MGHRDGEVGLGCNQMYLINAIGEEAFGGMALGLVM